MGRRITLDDLKGIASERGGSCLSKSYEGIFVKHNWRCKEGHLWKATPDSVKHGSWCPTCALKINGKKRRKYTIADLQSMAKKRNGICLSITCLTTQDKIKWQCQKGHIWEAIPASIVRGSWCRLCGISESAIKRSSTIEDMHEAAKKRNGKCLSLKYTNNRIKLLWECHKDHQWHASGSSVLRGSWCPECSSLDSSVRQRGNIEQMHALASKRGGKCLSSEYVNNNSPLKWECQDGHIWNAKRSNIQTGGWCPQCNNLIGETITRKYLEHIFGKKFPKTRPKWLLSKRNTRMELDGFCEELRLAFEHQGRHHYQKSIFTKNDADLIKRKDDDRDKLNLCQKHSISLIVVPEVGYLTDFDQLYDFLIASLRKHKILIPKHNKLNLSSSDQGIKDSSQLRSLELLAKKKKGFLLSTVYLGNNRKHKWQCEKGHIWETTPSKIKQGRWCHDCSGKKKFTLDLVKKLAEEFKGKCLSKEYINGKNKILWECDKGHQWEAVAISVKSGHWCPKCAQEKTSDKLRGSIEKMHALAKKKGGKCLSLEYVNARSKLKWKCSLGHAWEATPDSIQSGRWCRKCANIKNVVNLYRKKKN